MIKRILLLAAFAITPLLLSENASAQCHSGYRAYTGYGAYRGPAVSYRAVPHYSHYGRRSGYPSSGFYYGSQFGSPYRYGSNFGGYGGYGAFPYGSPFYSRGTSIGVGRGGVRFSFGF